jgi:hypothetical protein
MLRAKRSLRADLGIADTWGVLTLKAAAVSAANQAELHGT